jgi:hypothetical protein
MRKNAAMKRKQRMAHVAQESGGCLVVHDRASSGNDLSEDVSVSIKRRASCPHTG